MENVILERSFDFAVRTVNLYKYLREVKREYVMATQLLKCGTSIGANATEAQRGQSKADFTAKMSISLKEAYEAEFWIRLLYRTHYINEKAYISLDKDIQEVIRLLMSICKTAGQK